MTGSNLSKLPPLVFTYKDSQDGLRWVAQHDNTVFYLYMTKPITLLKYCQEFEKKTYIECESIYDALDKIYNCTKRTPLFKGETDTPSNYMA